MGSEDAKGGSESLWPRPQAQNLLRLRIQEKTCKSDEANTFSMDGSYFSTRSGKRGELPFFCKKRAHRSTDRDFSGLRGTLEKVRGPAAGWKSVLVVL